MDPRPRCLAGPRDLSLQALTIHHPLEGWHGQRASKQTNDALRPISPHRGTRARKRSQRTLHVISAAKPKACETKAAAQLFYLQVAAGWKLGRKSLVNNWDDTSNTSRIHYAAAVPSGTLRSGLLGYDEWWRCILNPACFSSTPLFSRETLWCSCKLLWRPCESQRAVLSSQPKWTRHLLWGSCWPILKSPQEVPPAKPTDPRHQTPVSLKSSWAQSSDSGNNSTFSTPFLRMYLADLSCRETPSSPLDAVRIILECSFGCLWSCWCSGEIPEHGFLRLVRVGPEPCSDWRSASQSPSTIFY